MCVCFGNGIMKTTGVWRKCNMASCYIKLKTCLVKDR